VLIHLLASRSTVRRALLLGLCTAATLGGSREAHAQLGNPVAAPAAQGTGETRLMPFRSTLAWNDKSQGSGYGLTTTFPLQSQGGYEIDFIMTYARYWQSVADSGSSVTVARRAHLYDAGLEGRAYLGGPWDRIGTRTYVVGNASLGGARFTEDGGPTVRMHGWPRVLAVGTDVDIPGALGVRVIVARRTGEFDTRPTGASSATVTLMETRVGLRLLF
jgi:hypothetical protein